MKRFAMAFLLSMLVVGCQDRRTATGPDATALPGDLNALIVDGAHASGNPDFFFLPPLQPSPLRNRNFDRGKFNPNLMPVVKICDGVALSGSECAVPLIARNGKPAVFNAVRGWDRLPDWIDPEQYHVLWQTRDYNLVANGTHAYRILVKVGSTLLGYLDIKPTNQLLSALRITAGGTDVGWLDDFVVPIRFRIEQGALCAPGTLECTATTAVGATADTIVLPSKHAAVVVPSTAVEAGDTVTIVIAEQPPPLETPGQCLPGDLVQSRGCYHFSTVPANYPFLTPVRIEACVNVEGLTSDQVNRLLLYKNNATDGLVALPRADTTEISCSVSVLGAADLNAPTSLAGAVWRGARRLFADLMSPRALHAAPMATPPKGLGGLAGSFSDVGGAVPNVPPGVVSWWPAEGNAMDLYGGNHGVLQSENGGTTTYADGIIGKAFQYSGVAWVVAPDVTVLDTLQRLSVEAWVKLDELSSHDERFLTITPERAVLRRDATNGPSQLHFYMNFGTKAAPALQEIRVNNALQTGCFQHVVGTYDGSTMRLYLNGALVGEHLFAGTVALGPHEQVEINSGSAPTQGMIDEARVFNRALSPAEIEATYAAGSAALKCPAGPALRRYLPVDVASPLLMGAKTVGVPDGHIYRVDPGVTLPADLTPHGSAPQRDMVPRWFPQGGSLVFWSDRTGAFNLYKMQSDGSGVTALTSAAQDINSGASVSPFDASIAYPVSPQGSGGLGEIWTMRYDGANATQLTSNGAWNAYPAWSPDGTRIAFASDRVSDADIYLMNADGSNLQRLTYTTGGDMALGAAWSPSGDRIAFTCTHGGQLDICTMDPDGGNIQYVTNDATTDATPTWSPDSRWIAFDRYPPESGGRSDIFVVHPDGTGLTQVTTGPLDFRHPSWPLPYHRPSLMPDQINRVTDYTGFGCGTPPMGLGSLFQSFTPTASSLAAIDLRMRTGGSFPGSYTTTINIRDGLPTATPPIATSSAVVTSPASQPANIVVRFAFPNTPLQPGHTYVIEWVSPLEGGVFLTLLGNQSDTYPGGNALSCTATAVPGRDYSFTTWW
jgi:Tol biopolymer transport system component